MSKPILVTSDIHGDYESLVKIRNKYPNHIHLNAGDIVMKKSKYEDKIDVIVKGNCDFDFKMQEALVFMLNDKKILLIHGHRQNVKRGLKGLVLLAKSFDVDLCIYGHTHQMSVDIIDGITFINPGSLRDYNRPHVIIDNEGIKKEFLLDD